MSAKTKTDFEKLLEAREDDAAEYRKNPRHLADEIDQFLSGRMSSFTMDSFSRVFGEQIEAEIKRRAEKKAEEEQHALDIFGDKFTALEMADGQAAIREFVPRYPNCFRNLENLRILLAELENQKQFVTVENLSAAYQTLRTRKAFIESAADPVISADEYRRQHPELQDNRIPALARESVERALNSFIQSHPEYIASNRNFVALERWLSELELPITFSNLVSAFTALRGQGLLEINDSVVTSGNTTLVDYGEQTRGWPKESSKFSFRDKIRSMSADEVLDRCNNDSSFKASLDALK